MTITRRACIAAVGIVGFRLTASARDDGAKAARAFLISWLVDQNVEVSLKQLSNQSMICTPAMDWAETTMRPRAEAKATLKAGMQVVNRKLGKRRRLADAISPLPVELRIRMGIRGDTQPSEFTLIDGSSSHVKIAMCGGEIDPSKARTIVAAFLFNVAEDEKEGMYFVFQREGKGWAVVSFDRLKQ